MRKVLRQMQVCFELPARTRALLSTIGLAQQRRDGTVELPLLTAGDDLACIAQFLRPGQTRYTAVDVVQQLLAPAAAQRSA